jgi:acetyl esterase
MSFQVKRKGGTAGQLDSQIKDFLEGLPKKNGASSLADTTPEMIRIEPSPTAKFNLDPAPVAIEEISVPARDGHQITIRIYRKDENSIAPPLIYYHGGCWIFCSLDTHDAICRELCHETGYTVFSVDYRLAPENKFPTGINDAYDAALWVSKNNDLVDVTNDAVLVCGDSAGANISIAVSLMAKESKEFNIRGQMLFFPITDISRMDTASYHDFAVGHLLTQEMMEYGGNHYINAEADKLNPLISPLLADNLKGMPKTLIQTAEFDVLRDEAENFAEVLSNAGVDVECVRYNGLIHAYIILAGKVELAKEAIADSIKFLNSFK